MWKSVPFPHWVGIQYNFLKVPLYFRTKDALQKLKAQIKQCVPTMYIMVDDYAGWKIMQFWDS